MDIWYPRFMQKPFATQAELFVCSSDLEHPALHALDDMEAVLDWSKIEPILSSIYASKTGRPSYPLLTLFRGLLLGVWYRLSDVELPQCSCQTIENPHRIAGTA
jgi:transposase, IS5 family